ncbi:MAG: TonB-dependent receptor [Geobacter sp.]|nr:TonB-dependent receptor [Geobacter sp.]
MNVTRFISLISLSFSFITCFIQPSSAEEIDPATLPLESLMDLKVTSVSKKSQSLTDAAAAIFVITQEDIRRSGVTNIPDALRMVPGIQVARIDSSKWAVSARGFNGRFSNKLLVLKDGRSIYTPFFLGVYWETQDTVLEDIDRIEVIRGPGASLWGANAVNGVINIITKSSEHTNGLLASAGGGNYEKGFATLRYGGQLSPSTTYRVYAKHLERGHFVDANGNDTNDAWHNSMAGVRMDSSPTATDSFTLQGDYNSGKLNETYKLYRLPADSPPPYDFLTPGRTGIDGGDVFFRWQRKLADSSSHTLQAYYDHDKRDMLILPQTFDNIDIDFQHRFTLGTNQDIIWGAGYRYGSIKLLSSTTLDFPEQSTSTSLYSSFIHDEISLIPNRLSLIFGARLEHNDTTGFELQPNGRLIWTPNQQTSLWTAVSRAVRTPTVGDQQIIYRYRSLPPATPPNSLPIPLRLEILGSTQLKSEEVIAYELGSRSEITTRLSIDVALFYNDYRNLRVLKPGQPYAETTNAVQPFILSNDMHGYAYGAEAALELTPFDWWRLRGAYSFEKLFMYLDGTSIDQINKGNAAGDTPRQQLSIRSGMDLGSGVNLDLWLRAVERIDWIDSQSMPGYATMDARISWKPYKDLELSLVGQNLFHDHRPEFIPEYVNTVPSEIVRSYFAMVTWKLR